MKPKYFLQNIKIYMYIIYITYSIYHYKKGFVRLVSLKRKLFGFVEIRVFLIFRDFFIDFLPYFVLFNSF